jgi:AAA15 family ATPase/GTPase
MKSSVQKGRNKYDASKKDETNFDFITLAKEVGYIKARQIIKQVTVKSHQKKIDNSDEKVMASLRGERLKDAIQMSLTLGAPTVESEIVR